MAELWGAAGPDEKAGASTTFIEVSNGGVFPATAIYPSCPPGYTPHGGLVRECQTSGHWNGTAPECAGIRCAPLTAPVHGRVESTNNHAYPSTAAFSCQKGYVLKGKRVFDCQTDGSFRLGLSDGKLAPTCEPIACQQVSPPVHGNVSYTNHGNYPSIATFTCQPGYTILDPAINDAALALSLTDNNRLASRAIIDATNSTHNSSGDAHRLPEDTSRYRTDTASRVCRADDGTWVVHDDSVKSAHKSKGNFTHTLQKRKGLPVCVPVRCEALPAISYGRIVVSNEGLFPSAATYSCDNNFHIAEVPMHSSFRSTFQRECLPDGSWKGVAPACEGSHCIALVPPAHGKLVPVKTSSFPLPSVSLSAQVGASRKGNHGAERGDEDGKGGNDDSDDNGENDGHDDVVTATGEETKHSKDKNRVTTLILLEHQSTIDVSTPSQSQNKLQATTVARQARLQLSCDAGYTLIGAEFFVCQDTGKWSALVAASHTDSKKTGKQNGSVNSLDFQAHTLLHRPLNGYFVNQTSYCAPIVCGAPPSISNARLRASKGTGSSFPSTMKYTCQSGFEWRKSLYGGEKNYSVSDGYTHRTNSSWGRLVDAGESVEISCGATGQWEAAGFECVDIDECAAVPSLLQRNGTLSEGTNKGIHRGHPHKPVCDRLSTCINTIGSYECSPCPEGYEGDGRGENSCRDIDECTVDNGGCDPMSVCVNGVGSYACGACKAGYTGNGTTGCIDVDECSVHRAALRRFEHGRHRQYKEISNNKISAVARMHINGGGGGEVEPLCLPLVQCVNLPGTFACRGCVDGYQVRVLHHHGNDRSNKSSSAKTHASTDEKGSNTSRSGNRSASTSAGVLVPIDTSDTAASAGQASFEFECVDVNECAVRNGGCDARVTCSNTPGGFECGPCPMGYKGDGAVGCTDIDECAGNSNACPEGYACVNKDGYHDCVSSSVQQRPRNEDSGDEDTNNGNDSSDRTEMTEEEKFLRIFDIANREEKLFAPKETKDRRTRHDRKKKHRQRLEQEILLQM